MLVDPLVKWINDSSQGGKRYWVWNPGFYLYLGLFAAVRFALWRRSWQMLAIATPLALQSVVMVMVNLAQDFRYQYGVYLMGLFSVGILFLMFKKTWEVPKTSQV